MQLRRAVEPALAGVAAFVFGAVAVLELAGDVPVPPPTPTARLAVGVGLAAAAVVVAVTLLLGRRNRTKRDLVRGAVRTGRLPDTDERVLHRILWERSVQLRTSRWSWLVAGAIQMLLSLSHVLSRTGSVYSRLFWGLDLAVWIGLTAVSTAQAWRERPKVERLLDELDERMARRSER